MGFHILRIFKLASELDVLDLEIPFYLINKIVKADFTSYIIFFI